jgi:type I restriction enzyme M protein
MREALMKRLWEKRRRRRNSKNRKRILWDGKDSDKIPSKGQLRQVMDTLRRDPDACVIGISDDKSLPYRPGLPLRQMNALFNRGHNTIRKMEKNEEHAFSDFSEQMDPSYLADYLRLGFGSVQIDRLYTGSTGMTELTPAQVNSIVIDSKGTVEEQKRLSAQVRKAEKSYAKKREEADSVLVNIKNIL